MSNHNDDDQRANPLEGSPGGPLTGVTVIDLSHVYINLPIIDAMDAAIR